MYTPESGKYSENEDLSLEVKRQVFHLLLISLWLVPVLVFPYLLALLTFLLVIALNVAVLFKVSPVYELFLPLLRHLEREKNLEKPGIQALYANIGILLSFLLFKELSMFGIIVLAVGDSLSTLFGKFFGRHRIPFNPPKSWEGTLAFFFGSFAVLSFFTDHKTALLVASLSALLESLDLKVDDNLLIPILASFLVYLM